MRRSCFVLALFLLWRCAVVVRLALRCGARLLARRAGAKQLVGSTAVSVLSGRGRACSANALQVLRCNDALVP